MKKILFISFILLYNSLFMFSESYRKHTIFPIPQITEKLNETFTIDNSISIGITDHFSSEEIKLAKSLVAEFTDIGIATKIVKVNEIPKTGKWIFISNYKNPIFSDILEKEFTSFPEKFPAPEGYVMYINSNRILIGGVDNPGTFYGFQSLRQLLRHGNGKEIQGAKIVDWPNLPFRALRLYSPGPDNIPFFKRFMKDFMALYKFNKIVIEFTSMRLDKHPELNVGLMELVKYMQNTRSTSLKGPAGESKDSPHEDVSDGYIIEKDEVKDIVNYANDCYLEVIPELPSLTHSYYLLTGDRSIAEYQKDLWPDTYCPSNPETYKLLFDVYDEYIEVIKPDMIHIGHDEWWSPVDSCQLCRNKNHYQLFVDDVNKIHNYLSKRGIRTAMWGDCFSEKFRGKGDRQMTTANGTKYSIPGALPKDIIAKSFPKDILIFNWFWIDEETDNEVDMWNLPQVYGNFKHNIKNWEFRIKQSNIIGGATSSWSATEALTIGKDLLVEFVGCANLLWSSHQINSKELSNYLWETMPYIRNSFSEKNYKRTSFLNSNLEISSIDITKNFNSNLDLLVGEWEIKQNVVGSNDKANIFELKPKEEKSAISIGLIKPDELIEKVEHIVVNEDVNSLIFLHACAMPAKNNKSYWKRFDIAETSEMLGWYEIVYEDGIKLTEPIRYGINILEWNPGDEKNKQWRDEIGTHQNFYAYKADAVDCSVTGDYSFPIFYSFEWVNKRFGKKIKEINLYNSSNNNSIFLIGLNKVLKVNIDEVKTDIKDYM